MKRSLVELHDWKTPTQSPTREMRIPFYAPKGKFDFRPRKPDITIRVALTSMSRKEMIREELITTFDVQKKEYYTDRQGVRHSMEVTRIKRQQPKQLPQINFKPKFKPRWLRILHQTHVDEIIVL